jgi:hypothetical protein
MLRTRIQLNQINHLLSALKHSMHASRSTAEYSVCRYLHYGHCLAEIHATVSASYGIENIAAFASRAELAASIQA